MPATRDGTWRSRPFLARVAEVGAVGLPLAAGVAAGLFTAKLAAGGSGVLLTVATIVAAVVASTIVALLVERLVRRLLPLATLLRLTLDLPDRAPSRFGIALRSGSGRRLRDLSDRVTEEGWEEQKSAPSTILTLLAGLTLHDRRTRGHCERVRAFTDLLSEEMGLAAADRERLRWAAVLHDIGKMAISPVVLNKPGRLDSGEWEIIRRHPEEGRRLTAPLAPFLGPWVTTIEQHHERIDGGGYPGGLHADEIALGARIVAVADAFETMTAYRSYKEPLSVREARAELVRQAGQQFDPEVVRAFLGISLPRLAWRMGPLLVLAQFPTIRAMADVAFRAAAAGSAAGAALTPAALVAGAVASFSVAGLVGLSPAGVGGAAPVAAATDVAVATEAPTTTAATTPSTTTTTTTTLASTAPTTPAAPTPTTLAASATIPAATSAAEPAPPAEADEVASALTSFEAPPPADEPVAIADDPGPSDLGAGSMPDPAPVPAEPAGVAAEPAPLASTAFRPDGGDDDEAEDADEHRDNATDAHEREGDEREGDGSSSADDQGENQQRGGDRDH